MGRPELCCVFCHTPVQQTEEEYVVLEDYLEIAERKPVCGDCYSELRVADFDGWRRQGERRMPDGE